VTLLFKPSSLSDSAIDFFLMVALYLFQTSYSNRHGFYAEEFVFIREMEYAVTDADFGKPTFALKNRVVPQNFRGSYRSSWN